MHMITEDTIGAYGQFLRISEKSPATVQKYSAAVRDLASWLTGREVTKEEILDYRQHLLEDHAPRTVNGALSAINGYLAQVGLKDCQVKFLKVQRQMFRPVERDLTREEFRRLVATAEGMGKTRLSLVMETICGTGIRVSEVQYITVEAAMAGKAEISLKGKIRTILLPGKLCRKLLKYAKKQKIVSGEIFLTRNGLPMTRKQIWAEMKAICAAAGVEPTKVFPHNLRHLFARCFYHDCRDVVKLADVLGHSSIETTRIYLMSTGAEHAKTLERLQLVS